MSNYFRHFPEMMYDGKLCAQIYRRARIVDLMENSVYVFLPYTIQGDDKPEHIATFYYGSPKYTWLVYMANDILDPYKDWVMDDDEFYNYITTKYAQHGMSDREIYEWVQDETTTSNILYYQALDDPNVKIDKAAIDLDPDFEFSDYRPVRIFDMEYEKNEEKRTIRLINSIYAEQFQDELIGVLNEGT